MYNHLRGQYGSVRGVRSSSSSVTMNAQGHRADHGTRGASEACERGHVPNMQSSVAGLQIVTSGCRQRKSGVSHCNHTHCSFDNDEA